MKELLAAYSQNNKEQFNKKFIMSRNDDNILEYATKILKSIEIIDEIKIRSVTFERNEEFFGPIKQHGQYYKPLLESRLNRIHYIVDIKGRDKPLEKDLYINKLMDHCFYINEGVRFFPVYQIVDNLCYSTKNGISLKSLFMPITIIKNNEISAISEITAITIPKVNVYDILLFKKKIPSLYYFMNRYSLESLVDYGISPFAEIDKFKAYRDPAIIEKFNKFFGCDIKFSDFLSDLTEDDRTIFQNKDNKKGGVYFSIPTNDLQNENTKLVLGMLLDTDEPMPGKKKSRKIKKLVFTYDNLITPWYWCNLFSAFFTKMTDDFKRYDKAREVSVSIDRLIDEEIKKVLPIPDQDKEDSYCVFRYLLQNFTPLFNKDGEDLSDKRIRLDEYIFYPLRVYLSHQMFKIINAPTKKVQLLENIFSGLTPMFLIKNLIGSQLLRYYNGTNEMDLYTSLLKFTFRGPQAISGTISTNQRDIHPSYVGRLSLVTSSAGDPGMSGTLVPFIKLYDSYFTDQTKNKKE